jgi:hypothetical protein
MLELVLGIGVTVSGKLLRNENGDYVPMETIHPTVRRHTNNSSTPLTLRKEPS